MSIAQKIEIDFTDEQITSSSGSIFLSGLAKHLQLKERIATDIYLKQRKRGSSEADTLLSLIYSLAQGDGHLCDVDRLRADEARTKLLSLDSVPDSRRAGELLCRFSDEMVERYREIAHAMVKHVAPFVINSLRDQYGYLPVFLDGTAIEVEGRHFEHAHKGYNNEHQYWLHGAWLGKLWVSQQLFPGGVHVAHGWQGLLESTATMLDDASDVWLRVDNAYYNKSVVDFCEKHDWQYSISVTNQRNKGPIKRLLSEVEESEWVSLDEQGFEQAVWVGYQPTKWSKKQLYAVIRTQWDGRQRLLRPRYTIICTNCTSLSLKEVIHRHRGKQGQENAQKGPLIDMDLHHPPCKRFVANRAFYTCGHIAQILLSGIQYMLLPRQAHKHSIRTVIRDVIRIAGKLVFHARRYVLKLSKASLRLDWLAYAADSLDALCDSS